MDSNKGKQLAKDLFIHYSNNLLSKKMYQHFLRMIGCCGWLVTRRKLEYYIKEQKNG